MQRAGRAWMHKSSLRILQLLFSFLSSLFFSCAIYVLIPWQQKWLHTVEDADLRGDSSFMLLTQSINCSICAEAPDTWLLGFVPFLPTVTACSRSLGCPPWYPCSRMAQCLLTEVGSQFHKGTDEHWKWIGILLNAAYASSSAGTGLFSVITFLKKFLDLINLKVNYWLLALGRVSQTACVFLQGGSEAWNESVTASLSLCADASGASGHLSANSLRCDDCTHRNAVPYGQARVQWVSLHTVVGWVMEA